MSTDTSNWTGLSWASSVDELRLLLFKESFCFVLYTTASNSSKTIQSQRQCVMCRVERVVGDNRKERVAVQLLLLMMMMRKRERERELFSVDTCSRWLHLRIYLLPLLLLLLHFEEGKLSMSSSLSLTRMCIHTGGKMACKLPALL